MWKRYVELNPKQMQEIKDHIDRRFDELQKTLQDEHVDMLKEIFDYMAFMETERKKKGTR